MTLSSLDRDALWLKAKYAYHALPLPVGMKRLLLRQTGRMRRLFVPIVATCFPEPLADSANLHETTLSLQLKESPNPTVSLIIPCYGQLRYTLQCLLSVQEFLPCAEVEIIVVDDASPDGQYDLLASVPGLRVLRNSSNLGFIGSCNAGASIARGEYLYFLNNDACLMRGSVDELLATLCLFPQCGVAGSQLLYPNGKLQEAGAVLLADASAINVGRFDDPNRSEYSHLRVVDYCSGASIMVRRLQFLDLGGFDVSFSPAYYEDADLCLRYGQRGLCTLYQPLSRVVHYEGISNGLSENAGVKAHQVVNQRRLHERWRDVLFSHEVANPFADISFPRGSCGRVLLITNQIPHPDTEAGSICELNLMLLLRAAGWQPTLLPEYCSGYESGYSELCQGLGVELVYPSAFSSLKSWLRRRGSSFHLVVLFRPETCHERLPLIRRHCPAAKLIYYPHDLHYLRFQREAEVLNRPDYVQRAKTYRQVEHANSRQADLTVLLSDEERRFLCSELPEASVSTLPLVLAEAPAHPSRRSSARAGDIVFVGNFRHSPNQDAVWFFVAEVLPRILLEWPDAVFHVVGPAPPPHIVALGSSQIRIHGFVEDLDTFLSEMHVSVLPLRFGAGVKGKLGVSLRASLPVVSTSIGVEGVPIHAGTQALLADQPAAFADAVLRLLADSALRESLGKAGLQLFQEHWGSRQAYCQLVEILTSLGLPAHAQPVQDPIPLYPLSRSAWPGFHCAS
jgi:GT2 family glycosyltransferase